jgi:2-succinyl-6-hydroxy-2,4-cyclohexadiene-1-carboxylate synthase
MPELWSALPDLPLPIRVLSGAQDTKFAQLGAELATLSPHIEHRCIAGVGHNLLLEAPEAIRRALTDLPPTKV